MIFNDFSKALGQMVDPRFLGVILMALGLTILLLLGFYVLAFGAVQFFLPESLSILGYSFALPALAFSIGAVGALLIASPFLMFPVAALFVGLFLDRISDAVEARHYPHLPLKDGQPIASALWDATKFLGLFLVANGIALIIYLMMPPLAPFVFWLVNGMLIGREYFQQVAARPLKGADARRLRRKHFPQILMAGTCMAVPLTIPLLNLVIPIFAVASFTHMYHRLKP